MPKLKDLSGKRFGRLLVLKRVENDKHGQTRWLCQCDCGTEKVIGRCSLISGSAKSCGCLNKELSGKRSADRLTTHGGSYSRLYAVWNGVLQRCENPKRANYKNYGGRGITVCDGWHDFSVFREWALDSGYREAAYGECTLDRINATGNYEPSNCRWTDMKHQQRNKKNNHIVNYNGTEMPLSEACEIIGINYPAVCQRINHSGWSVDQALTTPIRKGEIHGK